MFKVKRIASIVLAAIMACALSVCITACGNGGSNGSSGSSASSGSATLGVAYQYGLSYAPVVIAKEKGYIEQCYKDATGQDLAIEWNQMNSGADINTGITSGSLQVGFMGVGPAITGISKGLDYKVFANISGQEHSLATNDASINSVKDFIGTDKQIALVNIGSIQHIILAKALANAGEDPHALDSNIVAMKHPDGMQSLQSGNVAGHLTSSPYTFMERDDSTLHELSEVNNAWTKDNTFIVGVASGTLYQDQEMYQALCDGIAMGAKFIEEHPEEAAQILSQFDGTTPEQELEYLKQGSYTTATNGLFEMATFMKENGFIDNAIGSYDELVYDNVSGN